MKWSTKQLSLMALLTAIALAIHVAEAQIPAPVPIPGVKLGLANIVTVYAMFSLGPGPALMILVARILLGSLFAGGSRMLGRIDKFLDDRLVGVETQSNLLLTTCLLSFVPFGDVFHYRLFFLHQVDHDGQVVGIAVQPDSSGMSTLGTALI